MKVAGAALAALLLFTLAPALPSAIDDDRYAGLQWRATPFATLPAQDKRGHFIFYKTGQVYMLAVR